MRALSRLCAWPLIAGVRAYQLALGPLMGGRCRFYPSCSNYALEALRTLPAHRAAGLIVWRLARCHPLGGHGVDMVPTAKRARGHEHHAREAGDCAGCRGVSGG